MQDLSRLNAVDALAILGVDAGAVVTVQTDVGRLMLHADDRAARASL